MTALRNIESKARSWGNILRKLFIVGHGSSWNQIQFTGFCWLDDACVSWLRREDMKTKTHDNRCLIIKVSESFCKQKTILTLRSRKRFFNYAQAHTRQELNVENSAECLLPSCRCQLWLCGRHEITWGSDQTWSSATLYRRTRKRRTILSLFWIGTHKVASR